ncbi:MAG: sulfatase-like hydrolase/transferase [Phycisphaeraceae bacterium]|nr:sulfatase-like hydrolase/transferase [Phycisphaeraceae bacterium]
MMKINRIRMCAVMILTGLCIQVHASLPNVVVIYFDDTGWTDFGCFGGAVDTPHIDQLAKDGMRFTEYYAPAPNCSPSRTGLLTGRFPFRVGMYSYRNKNTPMHLPDSEVTIAEVLKTKGFATGMFGKWHLGNLEGPTQPTPDRQGFDYWFACDNNLVKRNPHSLHRNGKPVGKTEGWAAQIVADEANGWMKKQTSPFFAYIAFSETHSPHDAPEELKAKYAAKGDVRRRAVYKGMTEYSDAAVGSILKTLDDMGVSDNTIVFLASDNGPTAQESCEGLRGKKSFTWEGGIRVPAIVRWPGNVKPGSTYNDPVAGIDLLPTLCDIVGAEFPNRHIDGVSIRPVLEGKPFTRTAPILTFFYRTSPAASMRLGDYVLIAHSDDETRKKSHAFTAPDMPRIKSTKLVSFELYNVKDDLGQETDIASSHPETLMTLQKIMIDLHGDAIAEGPLWDLPETKATTKAKPRQKNSRREQRLRLAP